MSRSGGLGHRRGREQGAAAPYGGIDGGHRDGSGLSKTCAAMGSVTSCSSSQTASVDPRLDLRTLAAGPISLKRGIPRLLSNNCRPTLSRDFGVEVIV
jgi:hypothetical protein